MSGLLQDFKSWPGADKPWEPPYDVVQSETAGFKEKSS